MINDIIMSECCNAEEKLNDGYYYCSECFNMLDDLTFDNIITNRDTKSSTRIKKFTDVVLSANLEWYEREMILEMFPKIERYFYESERINFINMSQLARELCRVCGFENSIEKFKPLKTKMRVKQVRQFVDDAVLWYFGSGLKVKLKRLDELEFLEPKVDDIDFSKVVLSDHVFTDKSNINATKKEARKETKKEGKLLLKLRTRPCLRNGKQKNKKQIN